MTLPDQRKRAVEALAREIAERWTGRAAYLVADETWASALAEAERTYVPPEPLSPLQEAVRKAQGKHFTGGEIERMILATHPPDCRCEHHKRWRRTTRQTRDAGAFDETRQGGYEQVGDINWPPDEAVREKEQR